MTVSGHCEMLKEMKLSDGRWLRLYCTLPEDHDGMHRATYHWGTCAAVHTQGPCDGTWHGEA